MHQAEGLIQYHFGLGPDQQGKLSDEQFVDLAALAYFFEDRRAVAVQRGVIMAVEKLFQK